MSSKASLVALEPPPALIAQDPKEYLGAHGATAQWQNYSGHTLWSYYWPAAGPARGIVTCLHGHGSYVCFDYLLTKGVGPGHCQYEGSLIQALNQAGFSVGGIDYQGCGRSSGLRCYANSFQTYVDDVLRHAREVSSQGREGFDARLPHFLLGMSMGGCVALTAALQATGEALFAGVVCLAPMISLEKVAKQGLNPYLRPLASIISRLAPTLPVVTVNRNARFPDLQESYDQDPGTYKGNTRARIGAEYLKATEWLCKHLADVSFPFLTIHSEEDTQTDPEGSKQLHARAASNDKTLKLLTGFWHILLKEPGNEQIRAMILEWLRDRAPLPHAG